VLLLMRVWFSAQKRLWPKQRPKRAVGRRISEA
jgi:hypothetical protein